MAEVRERLWVPKLRQPIKNEKFSIAMNAKVFDQCYAHPQQLETYLSAVQVIQEVSSHWYQFFWMINLYQG